MDQKYRRGFFLISWLVKRVRKKKEICLQTIRTTIILLKSVHYLPNAFKLFILWSNAWKISVICFAEKESVWKAFFLRPEFLQFQGFFSLLSPFIAFGLTTGRELNPQLQNLFPASGLWTIPLTCSDPPSCGFLPCLEKKAQDWKRS